MKNIAIIPARSGSKGLKDKNIRMFCGMPLLAWTIKAALESEMFDEVMVSTDSNKYKEIALEYGARVPFLRSNEMSSDTASSWDVVREVLVNYQNQGISFDTFCLLQPTSPLRDSNNITEAYNLFKENRADAVVSVCALEHAIKACNQLPKDRCLNGFFDSRKSGRRQDAQDYYRINGAIYIQKVNLLMNKDNIYGTKSYAYVMEKMRSIDIDDEIDFIQAEALAKVFYVISCE